MVHATWVMVLMGLKGYLWDNSSALSILMNPDGGWRTRHLRLRSSCLRELLKSDPQTWKVRHQRGVDLPADMLTKPITLLRDWVKFWHFLGFMLMRQSPNMTPKIHLKKPPKGLPKQPPLQDLMKLRDLMMW